MKTVVLITGASSGIGLATAKKLLKEGYIVYASARTQEAAEEIVESGGTAIDVEMTEEQTMIDAVDRIIAKEGKIDVLINNAGYGQYGPIEEIPLQKARHVLEVNLFGLARLTQLVLPHMRRQGRGTIINTSSIGGKMYSPLGAWYHASKHALEGWSDCLRLEVQPLGINVIIIEPGIIDTGFNEAMVGRISELEGSGAYAQMKKAVLKTIDSGDHGSPPSVIAEVVYTALQAKRPKTRYYAGRLSGLVLFVRRYFSDRLFDKFILSQVNSITKKS